MEDKQIEKFLAEIINADIHGQIDDWVAFINILAKAYDPKNDWLRQSIVLLLEEGLLEQLKSIEPKGDNLFPIEAHSDSSTRCKKEDCVHWMRYDKDAEYLPVACCDSIILTSEMVEKRIRRYACLSKHLCEELKMYKPK